MGKLIAVYGMNGSGKTTAAVNIAYRLADSGLTGVFNTNTNYPSLQHFFKMKLEEPKHSLNDILETAGREADIPKAFVKCPEKENLFLLSVLDNTDCLTLADPNLKPSGAFAANCIREIKNLFDYTIADCGNDVNDPLAVYALKQADAVVHMVKPSIQGLAFCRSYRRLFEGLGVSGKVLPVFSGDRNLVDLSGLAGAGGFEITAVLPYDPELQTAENEGAVYLSVGSRKKGSYCMVLEELIDRYLRGGGGYAVQHL